MSIGTLFPYAHTPIIPVTDERIDAPVNASKQQQQKITVYNELLEGIYIRKTELETLEDQLVSMRHEIEDEIAYLAQKSAEGVSLQVQKRRSDTTAITAFVRPTSPVRAEKEIIRKTNASSNATAKGVAAAIANLKSVANTTKNTKSRGKGKGRQERAKLLNGTDLRYKRDRKADLDDEEYGYEKFDGQGVEEDV